MADILANISWPRLSYVEKLISLGNIFNSVKSVNFNFNYKIRKCFPVNLIFLTKSVVRKTRKKKGSFYFSIYTVLAFLWIDFIKLNVEISFILLKYSIKY